MKRILIFLSLAIPVTILLLAWLFPDWDPVFQIPLLHFYLVTFFTFAAFVVASFTAVALGEESTPRHQLLATAFAVMGLLFLIHGVTTPGAIIVTFNPGITWAAWLTLFTGGLIFALAALDTPQRPLRLRQRHIIHWALGIFCGLFVLIVAFAPQWLSIIDEQAAPWLEQLVTISTLILWAWAALRLTLTWRHSRNQVDGTMALLSFWFLLGTISLHGFPVWQLSWWLYHILLLLGVITAVVVLVSEYERLRHFRLTYYYAAIGLILTAGMALFASALISQLVEVTLAPELADEAMTMAIVQARMSGLLVAGLSMGLLYCLMLIVVNRADKIIFARNEELRQAYADLQAAEAMRDDLSDMIIHDLRSPLTSINLSLDLLGKTLQPSSNQAQQLKILARSENAVQNMMNLIDQLLDVARLEAGQLEIKGTLFNMDELLHNRAGLFLPIGQQNQKQIEVITQPSLPEIVADKELIGRLLDNLINNALKYTRTGGHILLRAQQNSHSLQVDIQDDGEGIEAEAAAHIFDKFYQVTDASGKPLRRGTGLGLTFCKLVVEAHNGRIWVESTPGLGSTFSFTLPISPPSINR